MLAKLPTKDRKDALLADIFNREPVQPPPLKAASKPEMPPSIGSYLSYSTGRQVPEILKAFIAFLRAHLKTQGRQTASSLEPAFLAGRMSCC